MRSKPSFQIREAHESGAEILRAARELLPQLSTTSPPPTEDRLDMIVRSKSTRLLLAEQDARIVGMLALVIFVAPAGIRCRFEDLVVDSAARGQGIGSALFDRAISMARTSGARTIDLTSSPNRQSAYRLFAKAGFTTKKTNVFRLVLD